MGLSVLSKNGASSSAFYPKIGLSGYIGVPHFGMWASWARRSSVAGGCALLWGKQQPGVYLAAPSQLYNHKCFQMLPVLPLGGSRMAPDWEPLGEIKIVNMKMFFKCRNTLQIQGIIVRMGFKNSKNSLRWARQGSRKVKAQGHRGLALATHCHCHVKAGSAGPCCRFLAFAVS